MYGPPEPPACNNPEGLERQMHMDRYPSNAVTFGDEVTRILGDGDHVSHKEDERRAARIDATAKRFVQLRRLLRKMSIDAAQVTIDGCGLEEAEAYKLGSDVGGLVMTGESQARLLDQLLAHTGDSCWSVTCHLRQATSECVEELARLLGYTLSSADCSLRHFVDGLADDQEGDGYLAWAAREYGDDIEGEDAE